MSSIARNQPDCANCGELRLVRCHHMDGCHWLSFHPG